jgi:hypothetical protein
MKTGDIVFGIACIVVFLGFTHWFAWSVGLANGWDKIRTDAIENGAAEWRITYDGQRYFFWFPQPKRDVNKIVHADPKPPKE